MGRTSTNPKKFVISCRVSHGEWEVLQRKAEGSGISITSLVRQSLDLPEQDFSATAKPGQSGRRMISRWSR